MDGVCRIAGHQKMDVMPRDGAVDLGRQAAIGIKSHHDDAQIARSRARVMEPKQLHGQHRQGHVARDRLEAQQLVARIARKHETNGRKREQGARETPVRPCNAIDLRQYQIVLGTREKWVVIHDAASVP